MLDADDIRRLSASGMPLQAITTITGFSRRLVKNVLSGRVAGVPVAPSKYADRWQAACMEPGEWELWQVGNRRLSHQDQAFRPCDDCPLSFAASMRAVGRCNGEPGVPVALPR